MLRQIVFPMNIRLSEKSRWLALFLAFICISFAFSFLIIKDFSGPLAGGGDIPQWEYTGFYVAKNLSFTPLPKLDLVNNQVFYPYGTNSVFQGWGFERDIFYAILYSFFGDGPWLQSYYLLTVLVTGIGTFALLVQDYGFSRASGVGCLTSFFNFYAIHKYPHHLGIAVVHWTTLSLIADFLIVKRIVLRQNVSLRLILLRACLLILSLAQDLGYIAGFALMSFTISILFIAILHVYRHLRNPPSSTDLFRSAIARYKSEVFAYPYNCIILLCLTIVAGYIYLPLTVQIAREAKSFDLTRVYPGAWWTNPFRLLIPFFPIFNPGLALEQLFKDSPEGFGAGSSGWFLLIIGSVGLGKARKRITIFIPLIIIFILCLLYHPSLFPTLKIFSWFTFNRVGGRSTIVYPVILCLFALETNFDRLRLSRKRLISVLLVCLSCTEISTAYSYYQPYYLDQPYSLNKSFFTYMNYIKKQPGEAVLDWPFCVFGANLYGANGGLCPYYPLNAGVYALRRFHGKKVMGQYFGRLHPSQIEPYFQAGWDQLLVPETSEHTKANHKNHCFGPDEWSFFTNFYRLNDFAGINLYVDLLPDDCVKEFYRRFGTPVAETVVPAVGRVKFLSKSPDLRNQVSLTLGISLKFEPSE